MTTLLASESSLNLMRGNSYSYMGKVSRNMLKGVIKPVKNKSNAGKYSLIDFTLKLKL